MRARFSLLEEKDVGFGFMNLIVHPAKTLQWFDQFYATVAGNRYERLPE